MTRWPLQFVLNATEANTKRCNLLDQIHTMKAYLAFQTYIVENVISILYTFHIVVRFKNTYPLLSYEGASEISEMFLSVNSLTWAFRLCLRFVLIISWKSFDVVEFVPVPLPVLTDINELDSSLLGVKLILCFNTACRLPALCSESPPRESPGTFIIGRVDCAARPSSVVLL